MWQAFKAASQQPVEAYSSSALLTFGLLGFLLLLGIGCWVLGTLDDEANNRD
jgi:hypothetical protein